MSFFMLFFRDGCRRRRASYRAFFDGGLVNYLGCRRRRASYRAFFDGGLASYLGCRCRRASYRAFGDGGLLAAGFSFGVALAAEISRARLLLKWQLS